MRSALRLVWVLDVRHLAAHRTRLALSAVGIAVGVSLAVAVGAFSSSVSSSLTAIAEAAASEANIEVRPNGPTGLGPQVLGRVLEAAGVEEAGATVESYVQLRSSDGQARVLVIGVDQGILRMAPQAADPETIEVADPFGLILPPGVAGELGVVAGDQVEVTTPDGWRSVVVGAVLADAGRSRVVVATVGVLQQLLGRGDAYDAIYVQAADPEVTLAGVQRAVGEVGRAGPIAFRSGELQQLLSGADASFAVGTLVALFVGAFLVYNTMAMAAVERLREAALLRAVGAKRRQVFGLFLAEGALLGAVGAVLGSVGGLLGARTLLTQRGGALADIYPIEITRLEVEPAFLLAAAGAGLVVAVAAAFIPARRVARAAVAPALGPAGAGEDPTPPRRRATTVVGVVCCVAGPAFVIATTGAGAEASGATMLAFTITLAGIALLVPVGIPLIARILLRPVQARSSGLTRLAADEILRSPGRTAFTAGAVLLSLGLVVGFSITQSSFTRAFDVAFEDILAADLYVRTPTWRIFGSDVPLDESLTDEIEAIEGVEASWPFRLMPATFEGRSILVLAYDVDKYARHSRLKGPVRTERLEQARALREPNSILASPSLFAQLPYELGDEIDLPTPTGVHRLRLAGSFHDPSAINPVIIFDFEEFRRLWGTGGADNFAVVATDRDDVDQVRRTLQRRLGEAYGLQIDTASEYRDLVGGAVGSVQQLIGSVQLVAVVVAGLGLANTLLISTFERRRDLGVLRAIGLLRRQLRRMVALEALAIGALGVLLAWGLGTVIGLGMYSFVRMQLGLDFPVVFPVRGYAGAAVLGLAAALLASLYPGERAARTDIVEALQYE